MPQKLNWTHQNDQHEINFSEIYSVWANFEMKTDWLNAQTDQNVTQKLAEK